MSLVNPGGLRAAIGSRATVFVLERAPADLTWIKAAARWLKYRDFHTLEM
ncbi:MAG: hypothetical protein ACXWKR_16425 [Phenylobacterium sp.]